MERVQSQDISNYEAVQALREKQKYAEYLSGLPASDVTRLLETQQNKVATVQKIVRRNRIILRFSVGALTLSLMTNNFPLTLGSSLISGISFGINATSDSVLKQARWMVDMTSNEALAKDIDPKKK